MSFRARVGLSCLILVGLSVWRYEQADPRGGAQVEFLMRRRESDSFRESLRRGDDEPFSWPGLSAAQTSWTWLEILYGLHKPASYEGDFSWIFSKLNTILNVAPQKDITAVASLAPFFFVIGKDDAGATLIMNEMANRAGTNYWKPWFWGAFHAMENLKNQRLAGDLLLRAAKNPQTPTYFAALSLRLQQQGTEFLNDAEKREALQRELDPRVLEKIKEARPEWFKN